MKPNPEAPVNIGRRGLILGRFLTREGRERVRKAFDPTPDRPGIAVLDRSACIAWNGVVCISCMLSCPERAIRMDARRRPEILADPCTGCTDCVEVCPTRAITMSI